LLILLKFHELPFLLCVKHSFLSNWTRKFFHCVRNTPRNFFCTKSYTRRCCVFHRSHFFALSQTRYNEFQQVINDFSCGR
jgi:hypothetical protein